MNPCKLAFHIGRKIGKHPLAGWLFCLTERLLPLSRLARREGLVAFHHPRPVADPHILIVPTRPVASLTTPRVNDEAKASLLWSMINLAQTLTTRLPPSECWSLIINGGIRQDVGQLHGHLMHGTEDPLSHQSEVIDPQVDISTWLGILQQLREADQASEGGFSLVFRWHAQHKITATITK